MPTDQAQDELNALFADTSISRTHPDDQTSGHSSASQSPNNSESESSVRDRTKLRVIRGSNRRQPESEDEEESQSNGKMRSPGSRYYLPSLRSEANTGPKGVIADARAFEDAKKNRRFSVARKNKDTSTPISIPRIYRDKDGYDEKSSADSDEESFMARWRQGRLKEMQAKAVGQRRASPSKRHYGNLVTVDAEGYLDAIEKVHRDVVVVVYIYDDTSDVSLMIEDCVRDLARLHPTIRFIKLHYEEAEMEPAGVPALLAYRGGDKFAGLVPVVDELPDDEELSAASLGAVLQRHKILP